MLGEHVSQLKERTHVPGQSVEFGDHQGVDLSSLSSSDGSSQSRPLQWGSGTADTIVAVLGNEGAALHGGERLGLFTLPFEAGGLVP